MLAHNELTLNLRLRCTDVCLSGVEYSGPWGEIGETQREEEGWCADIDCNGVSRHYCHAASHDLAMCVTIII